MRTSLSTRRARFYSLVRQADMQPSSWLISALQDASRNNGLFGPLARLACLRILVCRHKAVTGQPYPEARRALRQQLGV